MASQTPEESATTPAGRVRRGLHASAVFLMLLLIPAGLYAFYVKSQLNEINTQNLQRLDDAANATSDLIKDVRKTVAALYSREEGSEGWEKGSEGWGNGCNFFQRQTRLKLSEPADCAKLPKNDEYQYHSLTTEVTDSSLQFRLALSKPGQQDPKPDQIQNVVIQVRLDKLMEQIPFGEAFDAVMLVDGKGALLGPAIRPTKPSVMLPPGVDVPVQTAPVKVLGIAGLAQPTVPDKPPNQLTTLDSATVVQALVIAGREFDLVCQPMPPGTSHDIATSQVTSADTVTAKAASPSDAGSLSRVDSWHLCGLVDSQRVFRQALSVAPYISVMALALLSLCIVSWPILKLLSVSPLERVHFSDVYMMLLSTLALIMLLAGAVADITTHLDLRERSYVRLEFLADNLAKRLRHEIDAMYEQLHQYDNLVAASQSDVMQLAAKPDKTSFAITQLLLPAHKRAAIAPPASGEMKADLTLPPPTIYPAVNQVFWMRPCDGQQFIKASTLNYITPTASLSERKYFRAVKLDRLWNLLSGHGEHVRLFAGTASSISTGEFFAVVSAPSLLSGNKNYPVLAAAAKSKSKADADRAFPDCYPPEESRFAVALTSQLESLHYPVLAPGVGFAIIDSEGTVLVHSDARRSLVDNFLKDDGIATRLRAVMEARTSARLYAQYQTRPHQLFIAPIPDLPWYVVTFVDDEVLRTLNIEVIVNALALVTAYLGAALAASLIYLLVYGRNSLLWMWPRRDPRLRPVYLWALWGLGAQLVIFLLSLSVLRGWAVLVADVLLPLPVIGALTLAVRTADRVSADADPPPRLARQQLWLVGTSIVLAASSFAIMRFRDPVSASFVQVGGPAVAAVICAATLLLLAAVAIRKYSATFVYPVGPTPHWLRRWHDSLTPHIACSVLVWLLVGALPAYGFFKFALQEQVVRWMQLEQSYVGGARQWRDCQLQFDDREVPVSDGTSRRTEIDRRSQHDKATGDSGLNAIYPGALLLQDLLGDDQVDGKQSGVTAAAPLQAANSMMSKHAPVYNETTTYARYLERPVLNGATGGPGEPAAWSWQASEGAALLRHHSTATGSCRERADLVGRPRTIGPVIGQWGWLLGLSLCVAFLYALASYCTRKLCFGDIEEEAHAVGVLHADVEALFENSDLRDLPDLPWLKDEIASLQGSGLEWSQETLLDWCSNTTRRAILDNTLKLAMPYYRELWNSLSDEEKLLLHQLSEERFANPKQADLVRHLLQRGLLRRDPALRIMNDSFAEFVLAQLSPSDVVSLESDSDGWHRLRGVLLAALVPLVLFLTFTQRDTVDVWIAYLTTAAAGSAGIFKLLGMLSRSGDQKLAG